LKSPPLTRTAVLSPRSPLQRAIGRREGGVVIYATADAESPALRCTVANTRDTWRIQESGRGEPGGR
jgi:hypothetical protein